MSQNQPRGCLAALFGFGTRRQPSEPRPRPRRVVPEEMDDNMEGDIHSGPGGYEGMGYAGGYAAEYRARHERHERHEHSDGETDAANADLADLEFDENEGEY